MFYTIIWLILGSGKLVNSGTPPPDSILHGGDQVTVTFEETGQVSRRFKLTVDTNGQIELPVSATRANAVPLRAEGKTLGELQGIVNAVLAHYQSSAKASVSGANTALSSGKIAFCGEVQGVVHLQHGVNSNLASAVLFLKPSIYANLHIPFTLVVFSRDLLSRGKSWLCG
jgi:hypothetical protein